jgi:carbonic anhydrase
MSDDLSHLFANNATWAQSVREQDPEFFQRLSQQQSPEYLWIGCSDSRVPSNQIVGVLPGEVFVHRNIANLVVHTDLNCLSVLQFAVEVLRVRHVIVCGHYGCSGVRAALEGERHGLVDNWLRHLQDVCAKHLTALDALADPQARAARLSEFNVVEQVANVCNTSIVRDAWARAQPLTVHGWIYGVHDGLLRDLRMTVTKPDELAAHYAGALQNLSVPPPAPQSD